MTFSTQIVKTEKSKWMSKVLEAFSVWFDIKITEPNKCVGLQESRDFFIDWNWKILFWLLNTFFIQIYICSESLSLYWPCLKRYKYFIHEKKTLGKTVNFYIFYLLLNFWRHFASISWFYTWDISAIFGN